MKLSIYKRGSTGEYFASLDDKDISVNKAPISYLEASIEVSEDLILDILKSRLTSVEGDNSKAVAP